MGLKISKIYRLKWDTTRGFLKTEKKIETSKFLISRAEFLKPPRLEEFLNELGRRIKHKTAL